MLPPERNIGPEPSTPMVEPDRAPYGKLVLGFAVVLLLFGVGVGATWLLQAPNRHQGMDVPAAVGRPEISTVNQTLFDRDRRALRLDEENEARLTGFGWVNRDAGLAFIPIDAAMELVLSRGSPDGGAR